MNLRVSIRSENRRTIKVRRDNCFERYDEAVQWLVDSGFTTHALASRYDGMVPWDEILERYGLKEKEIVTYQIYRPDGWIDPQLNRLRASSQHLPIKRKKS